MAKKFVRGITDVKNVEHQDFDTNNVNDILSDGEHAYIHRKKKDGTQEYHNLTDNIKKLDSDVPELLSVTNYNNSKNSATLHPHHDQSKSQLLASPNRTINVHNGENGSAEFTTVDINQDKVRAMVKPTIEEYQAEDGGGVMKTFKTWYGDGTLEFKFFVEINKGITNLEIRMNQIDLDYMAYIIQQYGQEGRINIQGSSIQIYENATRIYFASNGSTYNPHFVVFFDIIPVVTTPMPFAQSQKNDIPALEKSDTVTVEKTDEIVADKGVITEKGKLDTSVETEKE